MGPALGAREMYDYHDGQAIEMKGWAKRYTGNLMSHAFDV